MSTVSGTLVTRAISDTVASSAVIGRRSPSGYPCVQATPALVVAIARAPRLSIDAGAAGVPHVGQDEEAVLVKAAEDLGGRGRWPSDVLSRRAQLGAGPEVLGRVGAPGAPRLGLTQECRGRGPYALRGRSRRAAGRCRWRGRRPSRAVRAARCTARSTRRSHGSSAGERSPPRSSRRAGRAAGRPGPPPPRPSARPDGRRASRGRSGPRRLRGPAEGNARDSGAGASARLSPHTETSVAASLRAATTVTCCPRTARTASSKPSQAPGARSPGRCATSGARKGSRERWAPIVSMSAPTSNTRRTRARIAGSARTSGKWTVTARLLRAGSCATWTVPRRPSCATVRR